MKGKMPKRMPPRGAPSMPMSDHDAMGKAMDAAPSAKKKRRGFGRRPTSFQAGGTGPGFERPGGY